MPCFHGIFQIHPSQTYVYSYRAWLEGGARELLKNYVISSLNMILHSWGRDVRSRPFKECVGFCSASRMRRWTYMCIMKALMPQDDGAEMRLRGLGCGALASPSGTGAAFSGVVIQVKY